MERRRMVWSASMYMALLAGNHVAVGAHPATWQNSCYATTAEQQRVIDATVFVVGTADLVDNHDGTWRLVNAPFTSLGVAQQQYPLCSSSPFHGEVAANSGRSGFLVTNDTVVTAPHLSTYLDFDKRVIVGLHSYMSAGPTQVCVQPNLDTIPAANIYTPQANLQDGLLLNPPADYLAIKLTTAVPGVQPLRARRSGQFPIFGNALVVGHPHRLSSKIDTGSYFVGPLVVPDLGSPNLQTGPGVHNFHTAPGGSGGPIYSLEDQFVESVLAHSEGNQITSLGTARPLCAEFSQGPDKMEASNVSIAAYAPYIPAIELLVSPLDLVLYQSTTTDPLSPLTTNYTISASSIRTSNLAYSIAAPVITEIPNPGSTPPALPPPSVSMSIAPGTYTIAPGQSTPFAVTTVANPSSTCRRWTSSIAITDLTNGWTDNIKHHFEIGSVHYDVEGEVTAHFEEIVGPYSNTTQYVITNTRPSRVKAVVNSNVPWLGLNIPGGTNAGQTSTIWLEAAGSLGDQAIVTASVIDAQAQLLTRHTTHSAEISFSYATTCAIPPTVRIYNVSFHAGRKTYQASWTGPTTNEVPDSFGGGIFGPPAIGSFNVNTPSSFCVTKVGLDVGFTQGVDYNFIVQPPGLTEEIEIDLASPAWEEPLWYMQTAPSGYFHTESMGSLQYQVLKLSDPGTPPLTGTMSNFYARSGKGAWNLYILDGVASGFARIQLEVARIHVEGDPGCPN